MLGISLACTSRLSAVLAGIVKLESTYISSHLSRERMVKDHNEDRYVGANMSPNNDGTWGFST